MQIRISPYTRFLLANFFDYICPKKLLLVYNRENKHQDWILNIWISEDAKVQFKFTILTFWTNLPQKEYL